MSDNQMLSQEEIDALLTQTPDEMKADELVIEDYLTAIEQDALGEIANISLGSSATALSQLVGQKVEITTPNVSLLNHYELEKEFPKPYVAVEVKYVDGFEGTNLLMIKVEDAAIIADLMMGGNGQPEDTELNELHLSAVQEAMNQMMGSSATSMSTIFRRTINISPPIVETLNLNNDKGFERIQLNEVMVKVSFRLRVGELIDSSMMQILPCNFAKKMISNLLNGDDENDETPIETQQSPDNRSEALGSTYTGDIRPPRMDEDEKQPISHGTIEENRHENHTLPSSVPVQPAEFAAFQLPSKEAQEPRNLELLYDIPLEITVELGRTSKQIREILDLSPGTIVELDKLAGEPVDILVNKKRIAKGEVVVIDENFGVRITEILSPIERLSKIQ